MIFYSRFMIVIAVAVAFGVQMGSARAEEPIATAIKGEPSIEAGAERGIFAWADENGVHVRWSSDGKPALFAGTLKLSKPSSKLTRTNALGGGWVRLSGEQAIAFSATAIKNLDGFDAAIPEGTSCELEVQVDGKALEADQLFLGKARGHAKKLPLRFTYGR